MKFYDNKRKEHDSRFGAICESIFNTVGGFLEDKIPGLNVFDEIPDDVIDGECREITDEEYEDNFFDPEEKSERSVTVGEVIDNFGIRFKLDIANNVIEIINDISGDVIDRITVTEALTEGFITPELEKYVSNIKTKESIDSLKECLDQLSIYIG